MRKEFEGINVRWMIASWPGVDGKSKRGIEILRGKKLLIPDRRKWHIECNSRQQMGDSADGVNGGLAGARRRKSEFRLTAGT
jgi:hypothetical protein